MPCWEERAWQEQAGMTGWAVLAGLGGVWPGVHEIEGQGEAGRGSWGRTGGWPVSPVCAESPCREIFLNFA